MAPDPDRLITINVEGAHSRCFLSVDEPAIDIGPQCLEPFACLFIRYCGPESTEYPVTLRPSSGKVVNSLIAEGVEDIRDILEGRLNRPRLERIRQAMVTGKPYVSPELPGLLPGLPYPRYYLDFENIQFVVPVWTDTWPYEQLPFQWSCQIERPDGSVREEAFLDLSGASPMRGCAEQLISELGNVGPVLTYSPIERQVIRRLAQRFPDLAEPLDALVHRIVDLLPVIRQHYYHPAMRGSFSIKAVLPTVAPHLDCDELNEVKDGTGAQVALEATISPETPAARRDDIERRLFEYCALDILAMVELVRFLSRPEPFSS